MALKIIDINEFPNCLAIVNKFGNHEYVRCPLINNQIIEIGDCFDCAMVAEHMAPRWSAYKELIDNPDLEKICLNCPNHLD